MVHDQRSGLIVLPGVGVTFVPIVAIPLAVYVILVAVPRILVDLLPIVAVAKVIDVVVPIVVIPQVLMLPVPTSHRRNGLLGQLIRVREYTLHRCFDIFDSLRCC